MVEMGRFPNRVLDNFRISPFSILDNFRFSPFSIFDNFILSPFSDKSVQMAYPMISLKKDRALEVRSEIIK